MAGAAQLVAADRQPRLGGQRLGAFRVELLQAGQRAVDQIVAAQRLAEQQLLDQTLALRVAERRRLGEGQPRQQAAEQEDAFQFLHGAVCQAGSSRPSLSKR